MNMEPCVKCIGFSLRTLESVCVGFDPLFAPGHARSVSVGISRNGTMPSGSSQHGQHASVGNQPTWAYHFSDPEIHCPTDLSRRLIFARKIRRGIASHRSHKQLTFPEWTSLVLGLFLSDFQILGNIGNLQSACTNTWA